MPTTASNSLGLHNETHQKTYINLQNVEITQDIYFNSVSGMEAVVPNDSSMSSDSGSENYHPYLTILVQPVQNFRFRYESEKGSHGGITGYTKVKSKKSFPTVQLKNYHSHEELVVKASLYTDENNPRPHILTLVGKKCQDGVCVQKLSKDFTAEFQSMTIRNKKKEEVAEILKKRKISRLQSSRQIYDEDMIEREVQEEVKELNLNRVRLCFEVYRESDSNFPLCSKILSTPICNQKNANSGNLQIVRLSHITGSCRGQQEILIFCDKVDKDDIKVRFHEKNESGIIVWEEFADFNPAADVHHHYAIGFRTPSYKRNIHTDVCVDIALFRPSDGKYGEPRAFTYIPDENDTSSISGKRKRAKTSENLTETTNMFHGASTSEDNSSSQDSNANFQMVNITGRSILSVPTSEEDVCVSLSDFNDEDLFTILESENFDEDLLYMPLFEELPAQESNLQIDVAVGQMADPYCEPYHTVQENNLQADAVAVQIRNSHHKAYHTTIYNKCFRHLKNIICHLRIISQIGSLQNNTDMKKYLFKESGILEAGKKMKLPIGKENTLNNKDGNVYLHYMPRLFSLQDEDGNTFLHLAVMEQSENLDFIVKIVAVISENVLNIQNKFKQTALHLATSKNKSNVLQYLLRRGGNPTIQNQDGNNCLHLAAKLNSVKCMEVLLDDNKDHEKYILDVNDLNYEGLAPLHLSILNNSKDCMKLLMNASADVNIGERKCGRSPLHLAIELQGSVISDLLSQPDIDLEAVDFRGHTPLYTACDVIGESYDNISLQMEDDKNLIISFLRNLYMQKRPNEIVDAEDGSCTETSSDSESDEEAPEGDGETLLKQANGKVHSDNCTVTNCNFRSSNGNKKIAFYTLYEKEICHVLDANSDWRKLGTLIDLDESLLNGVEKFSKKSSPTKTILMQLKKVYPNCDKKTFLNILEMAELKNAAKVIEDTVGVK